MHIPHLHVYPDAKLLCTSMATHIVEYIRKTLTQQERFSFVLSGGSTPATLYRQLAQEHATDISWERVDFFWGDERFVPTDSPQSNAHLAHTTLLAPLHLNAQQIYFVPTEAETAEKAAQQYEATLRTYFASQGRPRFDLILLGMGTDGHTASLFPTTDAVQAQDAWVVEGLAPVEPTARITLTYDAIGHARRIAFLITGESKAAVLQNQKTQPIDRVHRPAGAIEAVDGDVHFWLDQDAASALQGAS